MDEGQLLGPGEGLDGQLPLQGGGLVPAVLPVDHPQRAPAPGVFGPLARLVGFEAPLHIVGGAGVEGAVAALQNLKPVGHGKPPLCPP